MLSFTNSRSFQVNSCPLQEGSISHLQKQCDVFVWFSLISGGFYISSHEPFLEVCAVKCVTKAEPSIPLKIVIIFFPRPRARGRRDGPPDNPDFFQVPPHRQPRWERPAFCRGWHLTHPYSSDEWARCHPQPHTWVPGPMAESGTGRAHLPFTAVPGAEKWRNKNDPLENQCSSLEWWCNEWPCQSVPISALWSTSCKKLSPCPMAFR